MSWFKKHTFGARIALVLVAGFVVGFSVEALADTVYTWTTEDGTISYTDDEKHVPSRYRDQAQTQVMDSLDGYHRYTPAGSRDRLADRTAPTGGSITAPGPRGVAVPRSDISIITGGTRYGRDALIVPVDADSYGAPLITERRRVERGDSMATAHETVIRRGDRIISISRDEPSHRDGTSMVPPVD